MSLKHRWISFNYDDLLVLYIKVFEKHDRVRIMQKKLSDMHVLNVALLPLSGQYKYCSWRDKTNGPTEETGPLQSYIHIYGFILMYTASK